MQATTIGELRSVLKHFGENCLVQLHQGVHQGVNAITITDVETNAKYVCWLETEQAGGGR